MLSRLNRGSARGLALAALLLVGFAGTWPRALGAQIDSSAELAAFQTRIDSYVEMHRRMEGPLPPLMVTKDMNEVYRLKDLLRGRIREARGPRGTLITPNMKTVLRQVIATTLTVPDLEEMAAELAEHIPPGMPPVRVNQPLPQDAPFILIPPQLLKALPALPVELRYVVLSGALVIWDHHADFVVEVIPGLFDPKTYTKNRGIS